MHKHLFNYRSIAITLILAMLPCTLSVAEPKTKSKVIHGVNQPIEQIEFREITVGDALRILSEQSDLNIVASKKAADISVTLFLRRVTPMEVLDAMAKTYNLWYQRDEQSNIVRLYTVDEYQSEKVEYKSEETEIFTLKNAQNAMDLASTIKNLFSSRVRVSYGQNQQQLMNDLQQRFARFDLVDGKSKQNFSFSNGSSSNSSSNNSNNGGNSNSNIGTGNNSGGYSNTGSGQQNNSDYSNTTTLKLEGADSELKQEALKSALTGDHGENIGFIENSVQQKAPIYVGVIKHQNRVLVRTRDMDAMNEIKRIKQQLDVESSMLLMEVKMMQIELGDDYASLFDFKINSGSFNTASNSAVGIAKDAVKLAASSFTPALFASVVSQNFDARLQIMEKEGRVTLLGTPILLTANQEVSRFLVGQDVPVIVNYTAGSVSNGTTTNGFSNNQVVLPPAPVYETRTIGNTLLLTPNINADKTVNIQVLIEESKLIKDGATILVPPTANCNTGVLGDGCSTTSQPIDIVNQKTFSGSVIASDGNAIAVGGLIQEEVGETEKKVPVLGDVPLLGFFFRDEGQRRKRTELVVIIKPHIITSPSEAQAVNNKMIEQNSIYPNIKNITSMGVYSNPDKTTKDYKLEQKFKEYNNQDSLDRYKWDNPNPRR